MTDADYLGFVEQHDVEDVAVRLNMTRALVRNNQNQALQRVADRQGKSVQEVRGTFYNRCAKLAPVASKNALELRRQHKGTPATPTPKRYRPRSQKQPSSRDAEEPPMRYAPYPQRPPIQAMPVPASVFPLVHAHQLQYGYPTMVPMPLMHGPPMLCAPPPAMLTPYQIGHAPMPMIVSSIPPTYAPARSHFLGTVPPYQSMATQTMASWPYRPVSRPAIAPLRGKSGVRQEQRPTWAGLASSDAATAAGGQDEDPNQARPGAETARIAQRQ